MIARDQADVRGQLQLLVIIGRYLEIYGKDKGDKLIRQMGNDLMDIKTTLVKELDIDMRETPNAIMRERESMGEWLSKIKSDEINFVR